MDTANDLSQILLVIVGTVGSIVALLFLLAAIEPPTTKSRHAKGAPYVATATPAMLAIETTARQSRLGLSDSPAAQVSEMPSKARRFS